MGGSRAAQGQGDTIAQKPWQASLVLDPLKTATLQAPPGRILVIETVGIGPGKTCRIRTSTGGNQGEYFFRLSFDVTVQPFLTRLYADPGSTVEITSMDQWNQTSISLAGRAILATEFKP